MRLPPRAKTFFPNIADNAHSPESLLAKTTHLCIAAHQDDVEIMAYPGIAACLHHPQHYFTAVILSNGSGSDKSGPYATFSDADFIALRHAEQQKAAILGEYLGVIFLDYDSTSLKNPSDTLATQDILQILEITHPQVIYTHSPFDFHATHAATVSRVIAALRQKCPPDLQACYGCEVWGGLDWLPENHKCALDCSDRSHLQQALIACFDSQLSRGKAFDTAALGRRKANATFHKPRQEDAYSGLIYAVDLMEVLEQSLSLKNFTKQILSEYQTEIHKNLFDDIDTYIE